MARPASDFPRCRYTWPTQGTHLPPTATRFKLETGEGTKLRVARQRLGATERELAERSGVQPWGVEFWELTEVPRKHRYAVDFAWALVNLRRWSDVRPVLEAGEYEEGLPLFQRLCSAGR